MRHKRVNHDLPNNDPIDEDSYTRAWDAAVSSSRRIIHHAIVAHDDEGRFWGYLLLFKCAHWTSCTKWEADISDAIRDGKPPRAGDVWLCDQCFRKAKADVGLPDYRQGDLEKLKMLKKRL